MDPEDWGHVSQEGQDLVKLLLTYKPAGVFGCGAHMCVRAALCAHKTHSMSQQSAAGKLSPFDEDTGAGSHCCTCALLLLAERPTAAQLEQHSWVRHRAAAASQAAAAATEAAETAGSAS